ncbi:MAG: hypothetical protein ACLP2P_13655 [Desulfobaccales bacterium]
MQNKLLTAILIVSLLANAALASIFLTRDSIDYKAKYASLRTSYVSLARSQKYFLELFMKNQVDLKSLMPEYKDVPKEQFDERIRRLIVKLEMEIKDLEKDE